MWVYCVTVLLAAIAQPHAPGWLASLVRMAGLVYLDYMCAGAGALQPGVSRSGLGTSLVIYSPSDSLGALVPRLLIVGYSETQMNMTLFQFCTMHMINIPVTQLGHLKCAACPAVLLAQVTRPVCMCFDCSAVASNTA